MSDAQLACLLFAAPALAVAALWLVVNVVEVTRLEMHRRAAR